MPISTPRASWVLGVFAATFLATVLGYGVSPVSDGAFVFVLVVLSVPLLLLVHEGGHALASVLVGYRVTGIGVTADLDGWTEWEAPDGRETARRTIVALAGGPVITLALAAGLFVSGPLHGVLGGWRAGLGTFAILWTLDLLAPIRRQGIARDGWAIAEEWRGGRAARGDHGPELNTMIEAVDGLLLKGEADRARQFLATMLGKRAADLPPPAWGALVARLALAHLSLGYPLKADDAPLMADAVLHAPHDPVVAAVEAAFARRLGQDRPEPRPVRRPGRREARIVALAHGLRDASVAA